MEQQGYSSKTLDHLGLIAGICREIGIAEAVDELCPPESPDQIVSTGKALEAMVLNGLGFVNKRLYLVPKFFEDKPVEALLGAGIKAEHLNDDRLGRALDTFYESGVTPLFAVLSQRAFKALGFRPSVGHLDTTTLSAHGRYNSAEENVEGLHITQGYSKDSRPDLPQATLQLICEHIGGIPVHMEVLNGNSSDSESFRRAIQEYGEQLYAEDGMRTVIADSKLYTKETVEALQGSKMSWASRVPGTLGAAKELLQSIGPESLSPLGVEGYSSASYSSGYGGVSQSWVAYHSAEAAGREAKTLGRQLKREAEEAAKSLRGLSRQRFHCEEDALQAARQLESRWKWHSLSKISARQEKKHKKPGRPAAGSAASIEYAIEAKLRADEASWEKEVFRRSLFILATNEPVNDKEAEQRLLQAYKGQQSVERGFRFIKDPNIVASSFFVKKPERVEALLFVMAVCLLAYSVLEYRIREGLKQSQANVPDQKGKPTQKPTARWVFQLFVGIHLLSLPDGKKVILNLKPEHRSILDVLSYWDFYS